MAQIRSRRILANIQHANKLIGEMALENNYNWNKAKAALHEMSMKSIYLLIWLENHKHSTSRANKTKTRRVFENSIRHECVYVDAGSTAARNFHFMYAMHLMDFPLFCFMLPLIWKSRIYSRRRRRWCALRVEENGTHTQETTKYHKKRQNKQQKINSIDNVKRESMRARFVCERSDRQKDAEPPSSREE